MNAQELMDIALNCAGLTEEPLDTGIVWPGSKEIRRVLFGIDMDTPELLLGRELGYDCVVSHHPKVTKPNGQKLIEDQCFTMQKWGVPLNKGQKAIAKRVTSLDYGIHVGNNDRSGSAARLLDMAYLCIHTPADLIGEKLVQDMLDQRFGEKPETTLQQVMDALNEIREYQDSALKPVIRVGAPTSYAGRIAVLFSGGTGGGVDVYRAYFEAGVGTLVLMHVGEEEARQLSQENVGNVIVAGHMSSDSIGVNRIAQAWRDAGLEVTTTSGVI